MSNKKPVCWIIKCERFNTILHNNGKFYAMTDPDSMKQYRYCGHAVNRMQKLGNGDGSDFVAYALYAGDSINCVGEIVRAADSPPSVTAKTLKTRKIITEARPKKKQATLLKKLQRAETASQAHKYTNRYNELEAASDGRSERMDCAVKTLAVACGLTYTVAHDIMSRMGRRDRSRTDRRITRDAFSYAGYIVHEETSRMPKTVARCPRELPSDRVWVVFTQGHVLCVRDGDTHDWTRGRRHRPVAIWEIVKDNA